jgi:hypothetical protein
MKITTIDERDFDGSALELLRGVQPGESPAKYQNAMTRSHGQRASRSNVDILSIISANVIVSFLARRQRKVKLGLQALVIAAMVLLPSVSARPDDPGSTSPPSSPSSAVNVSAAPTVVIGFLGGFIRHDDAVHSEVQLAQRLRSEYPTAVQVETFENRRLQDAHNLILRLLAAGHEGHPSDAEKHAARIILYGHSWGASAVVMLARRLESEGIPVLLTIQVDSIAKSGQNDAVIPGNVARAANFYQDKGVLRGRRKIRAAEAEHTQIVGNFRFDYSRNPVSCRDYPWYDVLFMRSHIEIECDPVVWQRVEDLIREQLPAPAASRASAR